MLLVEPFRRWFPSDFLPSLPEWPLNRVFLSPFFSIYTYCNISFEFPHCFALWPTTNNGTECHWAVQKARPRSGNRIEAHIKYNLPLSKYAGWPSIFNPRMQSGMKSLRIVCVVCSLPMPLPTTTTRPRNAERPATNSINHLIPRHLPCGM